MELSTTRLIKYLNHFVNQNYNSVHRQCLKLYIGLEIQCLGHSVRVKWRVWAEMSP